jgi:hypothetical protein
MLLHGGELFGIFLGDESGQIVKNNTVDLGMIDREDLEWIPQSSGFDSYDNNHMKRIIQVASTLECTDVLKIPKQMNKISVTPQYTLLKCEYFPKSSAHSNLDPIYDIQFESMNKGVNTLSLSPGTSERFILNIAIDDKFEGSIGKWIVLTFKTFDMPNLTVLTETTFVTGILIKGSIISTFTRKKLAVSPPLFVPTYLSGYFDSMVRLNPLC